MTILQRLIGVDVFGRCSPRKCGRPQTLFNSRGVRDDDSGCLEMVDTDYRFVVAFENAVCNGYVTEKLYNALQLVSWAIAFRWGIAF